VLGERLDDRLRDVRARHEGRRDAVSFQRRRRRRPDGSDGHPREVARREPPVGEVIAHHGDRVLARENHPGVARQPGERRAQRREVGERLDADHGRRDDDGAERLERPYQLIRLLAGARHRDAPAKQGRARGARRL